LFYGLLVAMFKAGCFETEKAPLPDDKEGEQGIFGRINLQM
jgi:hypothetical protein